MRLMGIAESIEAGKLQPLHTRPDLFFTKGMTASKQMFIFCNTVYKYRFVVDQETAGILFPFHFPKTDTCQLLVDQVMILIEHLRFKCIEIWIVGRPWMYTCNG